MEWRWVEGDGRMEWCNVKMWFGDLLGLQHRATRNRKNLKTSFSFSIERA